MSHRERLDRIQASCQRLPLSMRVWILLVLIPVNATGFFMLHTASGGLVALATLFVLAANGVTLWHYASVNRALALPHLIAWVPLQVALVARLIGGWGADDMHLDEWLLVVLVVMVNSVALFFDTVVSWRWWRSRHLNLEADGL